MEPIEGSETSAIINQTPGNYPKRNLLYNVLYYYQRCTCFGRFFRPSSGAYKTVCAALGPWGSNPTTPAVDIRKA